MKKNKILPAFLILLLVLATALAVKVSFFDTNIGEAILTGAESKPAGTATPAPTEQPVSEPAEISGEEYRAVWVSYIEYEQMDFQSEDALRPQAASMMKNIKDAGLNTVILHTRPFGDAMYKSEIFPMSHIVTGTQGGDAGYDPFAVMIEEARLAGLRVEAWVNPYRVKLTENKPATLAQSNPAVKFMADDATKDYVIEVNGGLWYNPAIPAVRELIVDGVAEICENYDIDAVQFDDYFYPTTEESFDQTSYDIMGNGAELGDWRRENVNSLVRDTYKKIKEINPEIIFGISPQGNNDNNYNSQYSDVELWLKEGGYVDYVSPQIYWGFDYRTKSGDDRYSFTECADEWLGYERKEGVELHIGLGAYRIGTQDGSAVESDEWSGGNNIAKMADYISQNDGDGYIIYSYRHLWDDASELSKAELTALTQTNK